jgi:hypothetical protein
VFFAVEYEHFVPGIERYQASVRDPLLLYRRYLYQNRGVSGFEEEGWFSNSKNAQLLSEHHSFMQH